VIIRNAQIQALDEARSPDFEEFMVEHLQDYSPLHSQALGEPGIRTLIDVGKARAQAHGFTRRGPVRFYIETMILLGVEFDTDPQYPRLGAILRDASVPDQLQRADRAHAWLMEFLEAAGGPDRAYAKQALRRAREVPYRPVSVSAPGFAEEVLRQMRANHPEKVDYLGPAALRGLIPRAIQEADQFGVATDAGVCLFLGLMFAVGHGFPRDPKYPWMARTLANPAIADADRRVERLYSKTMTYLDQVLRHLGV
jgi:hypothetical protein